MVLPRGQTATGLLLLSFFSLKEILIFSPSRAGGGHVANEPLEPPIN